MSRDINPYALRLPPLLKVALKETAHVARRSLNAEIVARLEKSLSADGIVWAGDLVFETKKVYEVKPGVSTNIKFNERFTKKGVDNVALANAIEAGEKYLTETKQAISLEKKAILFAILYDLIDEDNPKANSINTKTIDMLLKLAS